MNTSGINGGLSLIFLRRARFRLLLSEILDFVLLIHLVDFCPFLISSQQHTSLAHQINDQNSKGLYNSHSMPSPVLLIFTQTHNVVAIVNPIFPMIQLGHWKTQGGTCRSWNLNLGCSLAVHVLQHSTRLPFSQQEVGR